MHAVATGLNVQRGVGGDAHGEAERKLVVAVFVQAPLALLQIDNP